MAQATPAGMRRRGSAVHVARAADALLEMVVIALAVWTVVYHVCLYLHLRVVWAATAAVLLLLPCLWLYARRRPERTRAAAVAEASRGRTAPLAAVGLVAAA